MTHNQKRNCIEIATMVRGFPHGTFGISEAERTFVRRLFFHKQRYMLPEDHSELLKEIHGKCCGGLDMSSPVATTITGGGRPRTFACPSSSAIPS